MPLVYGYYILIVFNRDKIITSWWYLKDKFLHTERQYNGKDECNWEEWWILHVGVLWFMLVLRGDLALRKEGIKRYRRIIWKVYEIVAQLIVKDNMEGIIDIVIDSWHVIYSNILVS